jgi:hypothetical protein
MSGSWADRVAAIGENLMTLEINTVVTDDISAQKMPEIPLALHTLVQVYNNYLTGAGFPVTNDLMKAAAVRVNADGDAGTNAGAKKLLLQLQNWHFQSRRWTEQEIKAGAPDITGQVVDSSGPAPELTNGAETFEALQWAAWGAIQTLRALTAAPQIYQSPLGAAHPSILSRIYANSRQLKEAALRLEQRNHGVSTNSGPGVAAATTVLGIRLGAAAADAVLEGSKVRLKSRAAGDQPDPAAATSPRLFGATIEETAQALFTHPRPTYDTDPDVAMLIRKAWDLGVERVCLQTVLQVDGDLTQIIADLDGPQRIFLTELHKQAVKDAVSQWRSLFDVVLQLAGDLGRVFIRG